MHSVGLGLFEEIAALRAHLRHVLECREAGCATCAEARALLTVDPVEKAREQLRWAIEASRG